MGAYYTKGCDGAAVFDHLAIAGTGAYLEHMNKYNVVYIDFSKRPDVCESYFVKATKNTLEVSSRTCGRICWRIIGELSWRLGYGMFR